MHYSGKAVAERLRPKSAAIAQPIRDQIITSRIYRLVVSLRRSRNLACRRVIGLPGFDWILLMRVGEAEPVMLTELAAWLGIDKGQASRNVNRIAEMGLIRRRTTRGEIELTSNGRRLYERGLPLSRKRHRELIAGASTAELKNFRSTFPKLLNNSKRLLDLEQGQVPNSTESEPLQNAKYLFPWTQTFRPIPMLAGIYGIIRRSGDYAYERVLGLSDFDWRVLSRSGASSEITLVQLVNELDRDKSQVGRAVKRLSALGLFNTTKIGSSRNVRISLTEKGKKAYGQLERVAFERHKSLINGLSPRELALLESLFAKFASNADQMLIEETSYAERGRPYSATRDPATKVPKGRPRKREAYERVQ